MQQENAQLSTFLHRFDELRARLHLSIEEMAGKIGYSRSTIQQIRSGKLPVSDKIIRRLNALYPEIKAHGTALAEVVQEDGPGESAGRSNLELMREAARLAEEKYPNDERAQAIYFDGLLAAGHSDALKLLQRNLAMAHKPKKRVERTLLTPTKLNQPTKPIPGHPAHQKSG